MLKEELKPTALMKKSDQKAIEYMEPKTPRYRTLVILFNMLRWGLDMLVLRVTFNWSSRSKGIVTRHLIERLGFLWVKLGQILSLRKDFFGQDFCDELTSLQNKATFFSYDIVRQQIHQDLGRQIEDIFSFFNETPLAAASIAQVHRAKLKRNNSDVVVKIMRPCAKEIFIKDLNFLRRCVAILKWLDLWSNMRWDEAIWEIQHMMMEETDYRYEESNLKSYKKNLKKHKVYVPKVFPDYCTEHVIVMEFVPGVLLSDFNDVYKCDPGRVDRWCEENDFDKKKAGLHLLLSFSRQIFEDNLYHADLHPGNIILLKNSRMALIDIGSVGTIEADLQRRFFSTIISLATKDYYKVADLMISFCPIVPMIDLSDLTEELVRCLRDWELKTPVKKFDYYEKSVTLVILEMVELMTVQYKLSIGWGFLKITRSWCNLESSLNCMMPESNNLEAFSIYFSQRDGRVLHQLLQPKNIRSLIVSIPDTINEYRLFIEPRIRRSSRVVQLGLKRTDHIIMGIASLFSGILAYSCLFFLALAVIIFSKYNNILDDVFYLPLSETIVTYILNVSDKIVQTIEAFFGIYLEPKYQWLWYFLPITVTFYFWRKISKFRGVVGDTDVHLDGFPNR